MSESFGRFYTCHREDDILHVFDNSIWLFDLPAEIAKAPEARRAIEQVFHRGVDAGKDAGRDELRDEIRALLGLNGGTS